MSRELPKTYQPDQVQQEAANLWKQADAFHANPEAPGPAYSVVIPPPNVTAALHLGHALNNTLQDVLVRWHRMLGDNTVWLPGTDHAGIATQTVVDKRLQAEGKPALKEYKKMQLAGEPGREQFIEKVTQWKDEYEARITEQLKAMGCSCDWERQAFTMDEIRAKAVREAFFQLFKDGLIYRGKRLVNWDPATQTALADDEVENVDIDGHFWYLKYPIVDEQENPTGEYVTVATTRPETMLGDTAVAVNPNDPPRAKYIGQKCKLPIVNRIIPIIGDDYVVLPDPESDDVKAQYASGYLKVTPAHDPNDWEIGLRHDLERINIMAPDGTISDQYGWSAEDVAQGEAEFLFGLDRYEAREAIVEWFTKNDLLAEVKPYRHTVGHSYRSHVAIEPYLSDQWYVKVTDEKLAGAALQAMAKDQRSESDGCVWKEGGSFITSRAREEAVGEASTGSGSGVSPEDAKATNKPIFTDKLNIRCRNLPHWQIGGSTYFVTFRLTAGQMSEAEQKIVLDACMHWHDQRADVHLVTVMPDHVHMIITPHQKDKETWYSLPELLHSIKSYSAHEINKVRKATGSVWLDEFFDRLLRNEKEFEEKWNYMCLNPVKAGLVDQVEDYSYTYSPDWDSEIHGRDARATSIKHSTIRSGSTGSGSTVSGSGVSPEDVQATSHLKKNADNQNNNESDKTNNDHGRDARATSNQSTSSNSHQGQLRFTPPRYAKTFQTWHENIRDWCISRQLWWGHRIPVWEGSQSLQFHSKGEFLEGAEYWEKWENEGRIVFPPMPKQEKLKERAFFVDSEPMDDGTPVVELMFQDKKTGEIKERGWRPEKESENEEFRHSRRYVCVRDTSDNELIKKLEEWGWRQDPDVLDTWFSSALWPMSTLGWPDETKELERWNPTSTLSTAREIITLWVSRMVMFNVYFKGCVPFTDVFIHAMIQDGDGRKMSKSLGNGVDPLDIIHTHGTDAMRFTLTQMTTQTQDVRMPVQKCAETGKNTSTKFDNGRNFCNKLWNAGRFALSNLEQGVDPSKDHKWSLADRWILSRLSNTIKTVNETLTTFQFSVYAQTVYDFFWRDLCDWYLEAIKPVVNKDTPEGEAARAVLATGIDVVLRLLHPVTPFITEAMFGNLNEICPERGVKGIELGDSNLCINAPWPVVTDEAMLDDSVEQQFELVRELITQVRDMRSSYNIKPKEVLPMSIKAEGEQAKILTEATSLIETLAKVEIKEIGSGVEKEEEAASAKMGQVEIYLSGVADSGAELDRLTKKRAELKKSCGALKGRLSNKGYTEKAPAHLVQETRDKLSEVESELEEVEKALDKLSE